MDLATDQLDRLIERQSDSNPDPDTLKPYYAVSVRVYHARRRQRNRALWCAYFANLADSLRARAEEYDRRAEALLEGEGTGL